MMVRPSRALCATLLLLAAGPASAAGQPAHAPSRELWVGAGLLRTTERDGSASPLLYGGMGASYAAGYADDRARARGELRMDVDDHGIASIRKTTLAARADLLRFGVEASYLRLIGDAASTRWRLLGGAALLASATDRNEHLLNGEARLYRSYIVSAAPALRVELDLHGDGALAYQAALPLLSGVTHPVADVYLLDDPATRRLRWRGPASYRQLEQRLSYSRVVTPRAGVRTTLMSDLYADADDPQRAGARSAVTVAVVLWTRRRAAGEAPCARAWPALDCWPGCCSPSRAPAAASSWPAPIRPPTRSPSSTRPPGRSTCTTRSSPGRGSTGRPPSPPSGGP
jgi:hypothetical protein